MNNQSWVETTVPPGYDLIRFHRTDDGKTLEVWVAFCAGDEIVGPEPRNNPADARRDMWRHWTAAVLRGRVDILWLDPETAEETDLVGYYGQAVLCDNAVMVRWDHGYIVRDHSDINYYTARFAFDVDEAMARFAMLVFFSQGPVIQKTPV
jgi:hypothetical protein